MTAASQPLRAEPQHFPCDALNVQLMRLRLRPQGTETWLDEQTALIERIRDSGLIRLPPGVRSSEHKDEELAYSVMLDLMVAWQSGRLLYFSRKGLDRIVRDYLRQNYWSYKAAGGEDEAPDPEDDLAHDPAEEVQLARLDLPAFRTGLAESPRRLLDWILAHGDLYHHHGWQTRAKSDLGVSDSWVSVNHGKLLEAGRRFFEVRP